MSIIGLILIIIVLIIIVSVIAFAIRIVPQSKAYVVERIGAYNRTCSVGLHILVPFLDQGFFKGTSCRLCASTCYY